MSKQPSKFKVGDKVTVIDGGPMERYCKYEYGTVGGRGYGIHNLTVTFKENVHNYFSDDELKAYNVCIPTRFIKKHKV